ncbi:hypothetical protein OG828_05260 [Streptomyces sp. NBC_00457]|uniref:hypothetical protein n=1 Tax=unclassified Streptomyces TaxID=2593676 RepID=UPI002E2370B7|nr:MULTISPECIES: hypothetical protein [unclassified Streptomyces]
MRAIRVASAALLGVTALALASPAAHARGDEHTGFRASVLPTTTEPGGQVSLRVTGCDQDVYVSSGVFDTVTIRRGQGSATAVVDRDAREGAVYSVKFSCGTFWQEVDLTIAEGRPGHHRVPPRGVHAGEGGSAGGFDLQEIGLGLALITGSIGAAYHFSRRRTDEDGA